MAILDGVSSDRDRFISLCYHILVSSQCHGNKSPFSPSFQEWNPHAEPRCWRLSWPRIPRHRICSPHLSVLSVLPTSTFRNEGRGRGRLRVVLYLHPPKHPPQNESIFTNTTTSTPLSSALKHREEYYSHMEVMQNLTNQLPVIGSEHNPRHTDTTTHTSCLKYF